MRRRIWEFRDHSNSFVLRDNVQFFLEAARPVPTRDEALLYDSQMKLSLPSTGTEAAPLSLRAYLALPIGQVLHRVSLPPPTTLLVAHNQTVASVLDLFHLKGSRCALVQRRTRWNWTRCMCTRPQVEYAMFDIRDLSYHVMRLYQMHPCKTVDEILVQIRRDKVWKVANVSGRVPFTRHQVTEPLNAVVASFVKTCRIAVFDGQRLVRVLSPADLLHIFMQAGLIAQIEERGNLRELARREAQTIRESETLLKAMSLMERHGYSAIPIVSEEDPSRVLEVVTVKDIKYLLIAQAKLRGKDILNTPALFYVQVLRGSPESVNKTSRIADWAMLDESSSMEEIFSIFTQTQVHRLILRDAHGAMTGILTLSDVMKSLADLLASNKNFAAPVPR